VHDGSAFFVEPSHRFLGPRELVFQGSAEDRAVAEAELKKRGFTVLTHGRRYVLDFDGTCSEAAVQQRVAAPLKVRLHYGAVRVLEVPWGDDETCPWGLMSRVAAILDRRWQQPPPAPPPPQL
jgi:hypothetical protein